MFSCRKLVVIGAGLICGSMIKALRQNQAQIGEIVAVGRNLAPLEQAKQQGFIDAYSDDPAQAVIDADFVVIGTPVGAMGQQLAKIKDVLAPDCIVTDVGSVKSHVIEAARDSLQNKINQFVPAHPISGTEHSGFAASFAELFQGRHVIVTPIAENNSQQIEKVSQLWQLTGAEVLQMSVATHDKIFAATSHLPHVLVYALMNTISSLENSEQYFQVVAGGFLDYTRIASSDAVMWRDVCLTNKEPILAMIDNYTDKLAKMRQLVASADGEQLKLQFERAKTKRDELVESRKRKKKIKDDD